MKSYTNTHSIICLGCARIIKAPLVPTICCLECGYQNDRARCVRLLEHAAEAVLCGYEYRILYERKGGGLRYIPSPADALVWVALAALSGVIGGAIYEVAKCAVGRVLAQIRSKSSHKVFATQDEFDLFIRYIEEYEHGLHSATPEVRCKIMMEVHAHRAQIQLPNDSETIAKNPELRAKLAARRSTDFPDSFDDLWPKDLWINLPGDSSNKS